LEATAVNGGNPFGKCVLDDFAAAAYKNLEAFDDRFGDTADFWREREDGLQEERCGIPNSGQDPTH